MSPLNVAINAQLPPGGHVGGIEQFTVSLIAALGALESTDEEYVIVGPPENADWLVPYLGPNQRLVAGPHTGRHPPHPTRGAYLLGPLRAPMRRTRDIARSIVQALGSPDLPDDRATAGFFESLGADVLHFPYQSFVQCCVPSVYNPQDLQHLHLPQFFSRGQIRKRETTYRAGCQSAQAIVIGSHWVRADIVSHYGCDPGKIFVAPYGPGPSIGLRGAASGDELLRVSNCLKLPATFALYPSQTWPHKNHLRLLEAIALLRDREGKIVHLVCSGRMNEHWPHIKRRMLQLRLDPQIHFLGYVAVDELRALYQLAHFVVFPSLCEGGGLPVVEAFYAGTPVACSNVASLPEYAGNAALLFDPTSVEDIARALRRMLDEGALRSELRERGTERSQLFTWERSARLHRAIYRKVAGRELTEEDVDLLASPPSVNRFSE